MIKTAERELQKAIMVHNTRVACAQHATKRARELGLIPEDEEEDDSASYREHLPS